MKNSLRASRDWYLIGISWSQMLAEVLEKSSLRASRDGHIIDILWASVSHRYRYRYLIGIGISSVSVSVYHRYLIGI